MLVQLLSAEDAAKAVPRLAEILIDAVAAGAGVSFMHPLSKGDATLFWRDHLPDIEAGKTFLLVCSNDAGVIVGTVMLMKAWAPNQPHRADVGKLLVHSQHQRQGVASALIHAVESHAAKIGLKLITFDAVSGGNAEAFYRTMGYHFVGIIPRYAYSGTGKLDDTAFFYKEL
jgi:GNAT superfamily N-acetyltransferase